MITIPTLSALYNGIINDINTEYGTNINPFGKAVLRAIAAVQAAKLKIIYLCIGLLQKNVAPDTCDYETLLRFGMIKLGRTPFAAVAGQYKLRVIGSIGAVIPINSIFKADDTSTSPGVLYILDSAHTLTATTDYVTVRCLTLGEEGLLNINDTLTPTAPIPLVNSGPGSVLVNLQVVQPLAAETTDAYRLAVLNSYRLEPQGGAATDYRLWAQDAQGVKAVYPYAKSGYQGQINLFVEATVADSSDGKGTPTAQILTDVETVVNYSPDTSLPVNENGRRPLQVMVFYLAVTPRTVQITITGFQGLTIPIENTLLTALSGTVNAIRPFIASADLLTSKNDTLDNNVLIASILNALPGSIFTSVSFTIDTVPKTTFQFINGDIPYFNVVILYV